MNTIQNFYRGYVEPPNPTDGDQWFDDIAKRTKEYVGGEWHIVPTVYDVRLEVDRIVNERLFDVIMPKDVLMNGRSVAERLDSIEQSLGILPRTPSLEKKYPHLEKLHNLHVDAIIEAVNMLSTIKSSYIEEVEKLQTFERLADEDIA